MNYLFLIPIFLLQACAPMTNENNAFVEKTVYDSPLKPCAYEYPDLSGNLCVVEINDKNIYPLNEMINDQRLFMFSRMAMARLCERSGGKEYS